MNKQVQIILTDFKIFLSTGDKRSKYKIFKTGGQKYKLSTTIPWNTTQK